MDLVSGYQHQKTLVEGSFDKNGKERQFFIIENSEVTVFNKF